MDHLRWWWWFLQCYLHAPNKVILQFCCMSVLEKIRIFNFVGTQLQIAACPAALIQNKIYDGWSHFGTGMKNWGANHDKFKSVQNSQISQDGAPWKLGLELGSPANQIREITKYKSRGLLTSSLALRPTANKSKKNQEIQKRSGNIEVGWSKIVQNALEKSNWTWLRNTKGSRFFVTDEERRNCAF